MAGQLGLQLRCRARAMLRLRIFITKDTKITKNTKQSWERGEVPLAIFVVLVALVIKFVTSPTCMVEKWRAARWEPLSIGHPA
jgi:hypothetical protein